MTTYYKATRTDGTSFQDFVTCWEVGKTTRLNGGDLPYLSVSTTPTDCTGFSWPCRLFEVAPVRGRKVTAPNDGLPNKRGSDAWRVVRELPAHEAFGPQGASVVALVERAGRLTEDEGEQLSAAGDAAGDAAWYAAGDAAWYAARYAAWYAARDAARYAAWYAARDAARGFVCRDLIGGIFTQAHYDTLTIPWRTVIGPVHPDDAKVHRA